MCPYSALQSEDKAKSNIFYLIHVFYLNWMFRIGASIKSDTHSMFTTCWTCAPPSTVGSTGFVWRFRHKKWLRKLINELITLKKTRKSSNKLHEELASYPFILYMLLNIQSSILVQQKSFGGFFWGSPHTDTPRSNNPHNSQLFGYS